MPGASQKTKERIIIDITYGSGFQKKAGKEMLVVMLKVFEQFFTEQHKENSVDIRHINHLDKKL